LNNYSENTLVFAGFDRNRYGDSLTHSVLNKITTINS